MDALNAILDEHDLTTVARANAFARKRSIKEVRSLSEGIEAVLQDTREHQGARMGADAANFFAGSSVRGDTGCIHWECRFAKVRLLARYGALYCDKLVVPLRLYPRGGPDEFEERIIAAGSLMAAVELRPLLERGLAVLVPEYIPYCDKHLDQAVPLAREMISAADELLARESRRFTVVYDPPRGSGAPPALRIKGPPDYLEHGTITRRLDREPEWAPAVRKRSQGVLLSNGFVQKHGILRSAFLAMARDVIVQQLFGAAFNARYLTDLSGEARYLRTLYEQDDLAMRTAALCARLTHVVPLFSEIGVREVLKVRDEEPEAFENYRAGLTCALRSSVRAGKQITDAEANEIYLDVLKPQLEALHAQAKNQRRAALKRAASKVIASSALLAVGLYGGILPSGLADLVKAIGGFNVARDVVEAVGAIERNSTEIRNHNLYFLLRLRQSKR